MTLFDIDILKVFKSIAECSKRAFCNTYDLKLPIVFKTFVLSIFEWPLKTGFTVCVLCILETHECLGKQ